MKGSPHALPPRPVTILCGFLGAGKTTLLKRVLEDPRGVRFGVVVNDFGAINIDAALVAETDSDQMALSNGCICCSIRDDLVEALDRLLAAEPSPDHIIIEASGVSRPLAILDAVQQDTFHGRLTVDATICLVDAEQFPAFDYQSTELAIDQAGSSDLLVFNKCDLASAADLAAVNAALLGPNPAIRHIHAIHADVPRDILFGPDPHRGLAHAGDRESPCGPGCQHPEHAHEHEHEHARMFETWQWTHDGDLHWQLARDALSHLPDWLLRAKGILRIRDGDTQRRAIFQLVGKRHSLIWDDGPLPSTSQIVFIGLTERFDRDALRRRLSALEGPGDDTQSHTAR